LIRRLLGNPKGGACSNQLSAGSLIYVRHAGAGAPVVLVHGLGVSSTYFGPLARVLARRMHVVAPDLPGWGRSPRPSRPLDIPAAGHALAGIIAGEALVAPMVVANSLGCQIAVELADRRPDLVGRLVLISPTVDPHYRSAPRQAWTFARDFLREPAGLLPIVARDYWTMGTRRIYATAMHALADRPEDKLPGIEAPMLVIRGDCDTTTTRAWAERCAALGPCGRFEPIRGAAHASHFSHPHEVAKIVLRFAAEGADHGD
jgi:pimeloyl-ACP methyl ester carboxylesterase